MKNILVLGGGFAGVWSAAGAVRVAQENGVGAGELKVTLVSDQEDMVIRPRLYEQDPGQMCVPLDRVLKPIGVERVFAKVTGVDTESRTVTAVSPDGHDIELPYDRLLLATGSQLVRPNIPGLELAFDVDTISAARILEQHLQALPTRPDHEGLFTAVVVGAGFTGLEAATELAGRLPELAKSSGRSSRVVLVDRADKVGAQLGDGPRPQITAALETLGVELRLGASVAEVSDTHVRLDDGETIAAATTVWAGGMLANPLTAQVPGERDALNRLVVDQHLRVPSAPEVFATGDTAAARAEGEHLVMQSCQHAVPLGKFAGHNAAADLLGLPLAPFAPNPYVTCLDLGPAGAVLTSGWDREVQMSGAQAKTLKQEINTVWIYPPLDDADALLHLADYRTPFPPSIDGN
jgi:NADH dehydrogenase